MLSRLRNILKRQDSTLLEDYLRDLNFPYLVSFPRTGSHWFRMVLELYSDRPLLTRSFFPHSNENYLLSHTHDMNLSECRKNVIYLYRNPTDVIFSQLNYYQQPIDRELFVRLWVNQYSLHLIHWIFLEDCTTRKLVISYEQMKSNIALVYKRVCEHLELEFDKKKILEVAAQIDKKKVASKTSHDPQVISKKKDYQDKRMKFSQTYHDLIRDILQENAHLFLENEDELMNLFY